MVIIYIGNYLIEHNKTPNFNIYLTEKLEELGHVVIRSSNKKRPILRLFDMLFTIFKNRKTVDYIYIDTFSSQAFWFAYLCGRLSHHFKIPYFTIVRGGDMETRLRNNPRNTKWLFLNSKQNISPSKYLEQIFNKANLPIVYIPNFLDINLYTFQNKQTFAPNILWVRALHQIYQPLMACAVLKELTSIYSQAHLTMVGPDKDGSIDDIKKYIQANKLEKNITITGKLSKPDWHALARTHDIFINTTSIDNHPVSVIEAMALGLPIVSTNAGGLTYLLQNGADSLLSDIDDKVTMIKNITQIIENPDTGRKLATQARIKAETFDWKNISDDYIKLMSRTSIK